MQIRLAFILLCALAAGPWLGHAQFLQLDVENVSLAEALGMLRSQSNIDPVFARRLVEGHTVTCHYEGERPEEALSCLLDGTGLVAKRVRRRQYVLVVAEQGAGAADEADASYSVLAGFVVDAKTGEVLPGAHVYLRGLQLGTITNEAGYFALPTLPRGGYAVHFSYLGYRSRDTMLVAGGPEVTVQLDPTTLQTDGVLVEARRDERVDLSTVPGLVTMPVQQLEQFPSFLGETDLFQALKWLPGVQRAGEVLGGLVVRGGQPDQNLYLLDGAPVYHPWHAFSLISTFQTETFKDIKLYRGTFPAEHGGRLAAVLDAEMKDGSRSGPRAVAALGMLSGRFIVESPITENSSFMVSGRRSYLDKLVGREHPVEEHGRRDTLRTGYFFNDMSAKVTLRSGLQHRFSLSYYDGGDDLDLRLPFDLSFDFSSWLRPADLFFEVDHDWGNRLFSARHQYLYSRRFYITTTAYHSAYRANERAFLRPSDIARVDSDYEIRIRDVGLKVDLDYYHSLSHQFRAGVQLVRQRFRSALDATVQRSPGAVEAVDQESRLQAYKLVGYVQDTWQPSPRWQVQPGVRASFFSGGEHVRVSPRLSVRYAVNPEQLVVRGGVGMQVQYLHRLRDRFSFLYDVVSSRWIPASDMVRPSTSAQAAIGAEGYPLPWLTLSVDGYWRSTDQVLLPRDEFQSKDGLVGPGIDVGTLLGQYTPGQARAWGVELAARAERGPWQVWLGYTKGRSLSRAPALGEKHMRPSRFDVPRSLRGMVNRTVRRWMVGVSLEWRSGYPTTVPEARYALGDPLDDEPRRFLYFPKINNGRLPPYVRLDLVGAYRFTLLGARARVQLQLFNITNRRNVVGRQYNPAEEDRVIVNDRRGLPFLPLLELQMEL